MAHAVPVKSKTADMFDIPTLSQLIQVVVQDGNKKKQIFTVPKTLLCSASDFFVAACKSAWEGGRDGKVHLTDIEPRNFAVFLTWAYTNPGNIRNKNGFAEAPPTTMNAEEKAKWFLGQWNRLARCWALGEFLQAPYFQNHIADLMISNFEKSQEEDDKMLIAATPTSITTIWSMTRTDSAPRRVTLDILMSQITPFNMRNLLVGKEVPEDFMVDLCECGLKTSRQGYTSSPSTRDACKYHIHNNSIPKNVFCRNRY